MNKILSGVTLIIVLLYTITSSACNVCGCLLGGINMDDLNRQVKNSVGVGYKWASATDNLSETNSRSQFHIWDVQGSYAPKKWVSLSLTVPVMNVVNATNESTTRYQGLGDIMILSNFKVLDKEKMKESKGMLKHTLILTAGLDLPTGRFIADAADFPIQQTGTKSTDFLMGSNYQFAVGNWTLSHAFIGKINTTNKYGYKFGNTIWSGLYSGYNFQRGKHIISPILGTDFIHQKRNVKNNIYQNLTGGEMMRIATGINYRKGKYLISMSSHIPVWQSFNNAQLNYKPDLSVRLSYNF